MLNQITPIVLTYNEEDNLLRTLAALSWAERVLVIDSGSTDSTLAICSQHTNVRVVKNSFINFALQCNFALKQDIDTEWVLSMDADYIVTEDLLHELRLLKPAANINAYAIAFSYLIDGVALSGSLYPPRICLYRHRTAKYIQDGHAHRVKIQGAVSALKAKFKHDDRKPYSRWLAAQQSYAQQEAKKLRKLGFRQLSWPDKLRLWGLAPIIVWPYTLLFKGLIRDGRPGLSYCKQRFVAEWLLFKELYGRSK